jgi:hypothetical protein
MQRISHLALAFVPLLISVPTHAQHRRELLVRLRDDVSTAVAHASLTEKQRQNMDRCQQTLLLAAQSRRDRKLVNDRDLQHALKDLEKAGKDAAFRAQDRQAIESDLQEYRRIERNRQRPGYRKRRIRS